MSDQSESHLIKQTAANNLQAGRDINFYGDINQTVIQGNIPQTNSLRTPYREVFKPLIENRLTLFGGRNTTLTQIAEFIKKLPSGYLVITAPAGFGKTSLMAKLVSEAPETFAYHFFAPYENFSSVTEEGFLRNVVEQMAQWHNCTDTFPEKLPDLQAQYHYFFDKPLEHIHVLVIDGLDEVTNWKLIPYLSRRLPENLHIILTVRDVGQDWAADYDLPNDQIEHLPLAGLTRNDVVQVMQEAGKKAIIFADNPMLLDEVMRVSAYHKEPSLGADPFYVRLLAEDASDGRLTHDNIATQPTGLESYLDRWWQDIKRLAGEQRTKDLFGTLIAALGAINRQDLEIINDTLVDDWATDFFDDVLKQVRRFVIGNEDCGYAIAHPRLRQYMRTKIRIDAYNRKLLDFCGSWQKHHSFYALRYYAKHLRNAKQWNDLYALARDQDFAHSQLKQLPNEVDLPLDRIQLALSCAAEKDNAGLMAEFMLRHAQCVEQIKKQESPLEALRQKSLERALKLVDIYEVDQQILWYLLLIWELKDKDSIEKTKQIIQELQKKQFPRFYIKSNNRWQGDLAIYFIVNILEIIDESLFDYFYIELFDNYFLRLLCNILIKYNYFNYAIKASASITSDVERIFTLKSIAIAQAKQENSKAAQITLINAFNIIRKHTPNLFWVMEIANIAKTQVEIGEIKAGQDSFKEAISLVSKITDQSKQANLIVALADALAEVNFFDQAFDILKKINEQNNKVLLLIAKAKLYIKSNQIEKSQICFAEVQQVIYDIENKFNQEDALLKLAEAQLELKDTSAALKTVENIDNYLDKSNILIKIVKLHIEENNFPDTLVIANLIKSSPNKANSLLMIAQAQIQSNPYTDDGIITAKMINLESWKEDALVQIAKIQARAGNFSGAVKTVCLINNETKKEYAISTIANVYALAKNYDVAKEMAGNICETSCQIETLGSIAKIEVDRNYTHTGISTFANALQAAKNTNAGTRFLSTLILLKIADLQIKTQQIKSGIAIIKFVNQITKNTYMLREETVILTLVSEVLGKAGDIQKALLTLDTAIEITQKMTIQVERVFSFTDIAKAQAKLGDFNLAKQTAEKIEVPSNKAEILTFISKEQALKGMKEESQTTLCSAIEIMDTLGFEEEWIHVGCLVAVAEGIIDREEAQATFNTLLNVAQASSNKARNLQIIAVALTEFEDIFKALTIVAEIQDVKEQVEALWAIGWKQFKKGEKVTILAIALEAKNEIKDEKHLSQILKIIAQIQVIAGEGLQAIKTLEGILIDLNWHLTGIASLFVETADKANFQKLLIPCAYRLDTAYEICGHIARMYPKQAQVVAEVIIEFNSVSYTNKSES